MLFSCKDSKDTFQSYEFCDVGGEGGGGGGGGEQWEHIAVLHVLWWGKQYKHISVLWVLWWDGGGEGGGEGGSKNTLQSYNTCFVMEN